MIISDEVYNPLHSWMKQYINSLDVQEVMDIVHTYEQCIEHDWCIVEETPHIRHTRLFLEKCNIIPTASRGVKYSDILVRECYRNLALNYMYDF